MGGGSCWRLRSRKPGLQKLRVGPSDAIYLEDLLEGITEENIHGVIDTGDAVGRENY